YLHVPQVILLCVIPAIIPVIHVVPAEAPIVPADPLVSLEVGAVSVTSRARVLDLVDYSSSSDSDPSEDSLTLAPELPLVSPFLCSDDSKADSKSSLLRRGREACVLLTFMMLWFRDNLLLGSSWGFLHLDTFSGSHLWFSLSDHIYEFFRQGLFVCIMDDSFRDHSTRVVSSRVGEVFKDFILHLRIAERGEYGELGLGVEIDAVILGGKTEEQFEDCFIDSWRLFRGCDSLRHNMDTFVGAMCANYEATRATNALEAKSQSQNGNDGDNGNGGNGNGDNGNGNHGDGGNNRNGNLN
ncbi:hypothetical protein Tco_1072013, partial [Tanacetum coccineum]